MKAIEITEQDSADVLRLVYPPDPVPGPGQVLIRVEAAAVSFSDVMRRRGDVYPIPTPSPSVPGAEVAGTVAAAGEGADNMEVGTRVFGIVGADASGGYAQLAHAYAASVMPIPPGLEPDAAAGNRRLRPGGHGDSQQGGPPRSRGKRCSSRRWPVRRQLRRASGQTHERGHGHRPGRHAGQARDGNRPLHQEPRERREDLQGLGQALRATHFLGDVDAMLGLDPAVLEPLLYDPAPSQVLTGFNLGIWFEHRLPDAVTALQRLIGWVSTGHLSAPAVHVLPLRSAAEAHRMLETGATTGKLVLKP